MAEQICIFCGSRTDTERNALFRLPPDFPHKRDSVYAGYLELRGITGVGTDLPEICRSTDEGISRRLDEHGRPVLVTRTGRSIDKLICPSCHNELLRDTYTGRVNTAVFFGVKNGGRTSLIAAIVRYCRESQFSPDERYRYFAADTSCPQSVTDAAYNAFVQGEKPSDIRQPAAVYRVSGANEGSVVYCDVLHDVSESDTVNEIALGLELPFAVRAERFVYCIPAYMCAAAQDETDDMKIRADIYKMHAAFRASGAAPVLDITVTKTDLAPSGSPLAGDDMGAVADTVRTAFPCIDELGGLFADVRYHTVSLKTGGGNAAGRLFAELAG